MAFRRDSGSHATSLHITFGTQRVTVSDADFDTKNVAYKFTGAK